MPADLAQELAHARDAVRPLAASLDRAALEVYAPLAWDASMAGLPVLHLDDVSAIPFLIDIEGVEEYQHRARLRAGDGDLFAAGTPRDEHYERYCRETLRLGAPALVNAPAEPDPLAVAEACARGAALAQLAAHARRAGGLVIHPYMGIESVWDLAARVAADSQTRVGVLAPPPPVTWVANDKGTFGRAVELVLGVDYLVETLHGSSLDALAGHLRDLATRHPRVALKRLRCASAMGNAVFEAARVTSLAPAALQTEIHRFLERTEWDGREEVLAVAWEETDHSPSTQLWIPPDGTGPPRLDGVYEQILKGRRRIFVGSRPSGLPTPVNRNLARASLLVAAGLQRLGYVGRCSFDFLVVGDPAGDFELRFTECNGRWGGTSTPMAFLDRLVGGPRPPYRAQDFVHEGLVGVPFVDILAAVGNEAFDPATGRGRFVFYNVGPLERFGKLDVIALGASQDEAEVAMEEGLGRLLGLRT